VKKRIWDRVSLPFSDNQMQMEPPTEGILSFFPGPRLKLSDCFTYLYIQILERTSKFISQEDLVVTLPVSLAFSVSFPLGLNSMVMRFPNFDRGDGFGPMWSLNPRPFVIQSYFQDRLARCSHNFQIFQLSNGYGHCSRFFSSSLECSQIRCLVHRLVEALLGPVDPPLSPLPPPSGVSPS